MNDDTHNFAKRGFGTYTFKPNGSAHQSVFSPDSMGFCAVCDGDWRESLGAVHSTCSDHHQMVCDFYAQVAL